MLYNSTSPLGVLIIGTAMIISGLLFFFVGNIWVGLFLLIAGLFFFITGLFLKKYYVPKKGLARFIAQCQYGDDDLRNESK